VNLFFARIAFWLATLSVVLDYFSRFNRTFDNYYALPFSGRIVDAMYPKALSVRAEVSAPGAMAEYLDRVVRKGETFMYFGDGDPLEGTDAGEGSRRMIVLGTGQPRLVVEDPRPWLLEKTRAFLDKVSVPDEYRPSWTEKRIRHCDIGLLPLKKVSCKEGENTLTSNFVFESAWFTRYCFIVTGRDLAREWLRELEKFLRRRQNVLASARHTVNIVWDFDDAIPEERLKELVFLCGETNYKLMLISPGDAAARFAETYPEIPARV